MSDTGKESNVLRLCSDCCHYRQHRCHRGAWTSIAPTTGVIKQIGSVDALIERRRYHAYRCGPSGRYWNVE